MATYKLFIRYALSGLVERELSCQTKDDLYKYVGELVLKSIEKIERIDYKVLNDAIQTISKAEEEKL